MQHDLRPRAEGAGAAIEGGESRVGGKTLTQGMKGAKLSPAEQKQATGASPPPDAAASWPGDDATGTETIYSDRYHNPHAARFERKRHDAPDAKTDKHYNKPGIHNDDATRTTAGRPGAVVHDKQGHTHGIFDIKPAEATRYLYVCRDGRNEAYPVDLVEKSKLITHNPKAHHGGKVPTNKQRLFLNPAEPQELYLPGQTKPDWCVLSWLDGMTAAWIKVDDLDAGKHITATHIRNAVAARAKKWDPDAAGKTSGDIEKHSKRFVFRNDEVGQADAKDRGPHYKDKGAKKATDHPRVVGKGQTAGDNVPHYLDKDLRKPAFGADGTAKGVNVTRSLVSICMNLPEGHVPPVAIDTAVAGESFFMMNDPKFHREVPVYENGAQHSKLVQKWVFGHLAMRKGSELVPDPHRRGWVPFRVLAETGTDEHGKQKLHMKEIEQRKPEPKKD